MYVGKNKWPVHTGSLPSLGELALKVGFLLLPSPGRKGAGVSEKRLVNLGSPSAHLFP